jgi:hypothetical protein
LANDRKSRIAQATAFNRAESESEISGKDWTGDGASGGVEARGKIDGDIKVGCTFFLSDPSKNCSFGGTGWRNRTESEESIDNKSRSLGLKKAGGFGGPDDGFFPEFGFDSRIRMETPTDGAGEEVFDGPPEIFEFEAEKDSIVPVMAWADEDEGDAGRWKERCEFREGTRDGLAHEIFDAGTRMDAFFFPSPREVRRENDHGPRRMTVAAEWVRVWVRVTRERLIPLV